MDSVLRTRRGVVSFLGAAGLFAAGVLLLTSFTRPVGAAQSAAVRETARMPDGPESPLVGAALTVLQDLLRGREFASVRRCGTGTKERPFRTIGKAADVLQAGERVVIAEGIYREVVQPPRGGTGPDQMISYEAADGAKVIIRGSAILNAGWRPSAAVQGRGGGPGAGPGADVGRRSGRRLVRWLQPVRHDEHAAAALAIHEPHEHQCPRAPGAVHARARHDVRGRQAAGSGEGHERALRTRSELGHWHLADNRTRPSSSVSWAAGWASTSSIKAVCRCASDCQMTTALTST